MNENPKHGSEATANDEVIEGATAREGNGNSRGANKMDRNAHYSTHTRTHARTHTHTHTHRNRQSRLLTWISDYKEPAGAI